MIFDFIFALRAILFANFEHLLRRQKSILEPIPEMSVAGLLLAHQVLYPVLRHAKATPPFVNPRTK